MSNAVERGDTKVLPMLNNAQCLQQKGGLASMSFNFKEELQFRRVNLPKCCFCFTHCTCVSQPGTHGICSPLISLFACIFGHPSVPPCFFFPFYPKLLLPSVVHTAFPSSSLAAFVCLSPDTPKWRPLIHFEVLHALHHSSPPTGFACKPKAQRCIVGGKREAQQAPLRPEGTQTPSDGSAGQFGVTAGIFLVFFLDNPLVTLCAPGVGTCSPLEVVWWQLVATEMIEGAACTMRINGYPRAATNRILFHTNCLLTEGEQLHGGRFAFSGGRAGLVLVCNPPPPQTLKDSGAGAMGPTAPNFLSHA